MTDSPAVIAAQNVIYQMVNHPIARWDLATAIVDVVGPLIRAEILAETTPELDGARCGSCSQHETIERLRALLDEPLRAAGVGREVVAALTSQAKTAEAAQVEAENARDGLYSEVVSLRAAEQRLREMVEDGYRDGQTRWSGGQIFDALDDDNRALSGPMPYDREDDERALDVYCGPRAGIAPVNPFGPPLRNLIPRETPTTTTEMP